MLKANELRIGNALLNGSGELLTVYGIQVEVNDIATFTKVYTNPECTKYYHIEGLQPIPLTAEWLERLGFEKTFDQKGDTFWMSYKWREFTFDTVSSIDCSVIYLRGFCDAMAKYVHELQNIVYANTGRELKIKESL